MARAIGTGTAGKVKLLSPFCNMTKGKSRRSGQNSARISPSPGAATTAAKSTAANAAPAGERKEAFREAGIPDPTVYED